MTAEEEDVLCPQDKLPFFPLMYLGPEALAELYPYLKACLDNNFSGGETEAQLRNLVNGTRAHLQHYNIWVD